MVRIFVKIADKQLSFVIVFVFIAKVNIKLNIPGSLNIFYHLLENNPIVIIFWGGFFF